MVWDTGTPHREFLHSDTVEVRLRQMSLPEMDFSKAISGFPPRKLLDVSRVSALGWTPRIEMRDGITQAYSEFRQGFAAAT